MHSYPFYALAVCAAAGRALISLSDKANLDMLVKVRCT